MSDGVPAISYASMKWRKLKSLAEKQRFWGWFLFIVEWSKNVSACPGDFGFWVDAISWLNNMRKTSQPGLFSIPIKESNISFIRFYKYCLSSHASAFLSVLKCLGNVGILYYAVAAGCQFIANGLSKHASPVKLFFTCHPISLLVRFGLGECVSCAVLAN